MKKQKVTREPLLIDMIVCFDETDGQEFYSAKYTREQIASSYLNNYDEQLDINDLVEVWLRHVPKSKDASGFVGPDYYKIYEKKPEKLRGYIRCWTSI